MDSITITLAEKQFSIQPLTVGQLEEMHVGLLLPPNADPSEGVKDWWQQTREIIVTALCEDHPDMTMDVVKKMRLGTLKVVRETREQILIFAGFQDKPKEGTPQGEAPQGEATAAAE